MTEYKILNRRFSYRDPNHPNKPEDLALDLNALAEEGWELVSCVPQGTGYLCALRRSK